MARLVPENTKNIAVIGAGYWGKNLIRTFNSLGVLNTVYDFDKTTLRKFADDPVYTGVEFGTDYTGCLHRWDIQGVVIATPPYTHYEIAKACLLAGKDVFIEKPMTMDVEEAKELIAIASGWKDTRTRGRFPKVLLVGHIFLYSPEIIKLKEIISAPTFGDIRYIYTRRLNLGKVQNCGVIMDLAPHDISIFDYLLEDSCVSAKATAASHVIDDVDDVAFIDLKYSKGCTAHMHLSWLDPLKTRDTVVVGSRQMAVCDSGTKSIAIYNKSIDIEARSESSNDSYGQHLLSYKYGDVVYPYIDNVEPMKMEALDFINACKTSSTPKASGELGADVVNTLTTIIKASKSGVWEDVPDA